MSKNMVISVGLSLLLLTAGCSYYKKRAEMNEAYEDVMALSQADNHEEAVVKWTEFIDEYLEIAPVNWRHNPYEQRAWSYMQIGKTNEAVADYEIAIEIYSSTEKKPLSRIYGYAAYAYMECRNKEKGRAYHEKALELNPDNRYSLDCMVWLLLSETNAAPETKALTVAYAKKACKMSQWEKPQAIENLAHAYDAAGNQDLALHYHREATERRPADHPMGLNNLAWYYAITEGLKQNDYQEALTHSIKANELTGGTNEACADTMAAVYARLGDYGKAVEWQERALVLVREEDRKGSEERLALYQAGKPYTENPVE